MERASRIQVWDTLSDLIQSKELDPASVLQLSPKKGVLEANGKQVITISFCPPVPDFYTFTVSCLLWSGNFEGEAKITSTCEIVGIGVNPKLQVVDARANGISTRRLWQQFSLDKLNDQFNAEISSIEVSQYWSD